MIIRPPVPGTYESRPLAACQRLVYKIHRHEMSVAPNFALRYTSLFEIDIIPSHYFLGGPKVPPGWFLIDPVIIDLSVSRFNVLVQHALLWQIC